MTEHILEQTDLPAASSRPNRRVKAVDQARIDAWDDDLWFAKLNVVVKFIGEAGRAPCNHREAGPFERMLTQWVADVVSKFNAGTLGLYRSEAIFVLAPEVQEVLLLDRWKRMLALCNGFVANYARLPEGASENTSEAFVGRWLEQQRGKAMCQLVEKVQVGLLGGCEMALVDFFDASVGANGKVLTIV